MVEIDEQVERKDHEEEEVNHAGANVFVGEDCFDLRCRAFACSLTRWRLIRRSTIDFVEEVVDLTPVLAVAPASCIVKFLVHIKSIDRV